MFLRTFSIEQNRCRFVCSCTIFSIFHFQKISNTNLNHRQRESNEIEYEQKKQKITNKLKISHFTSCLHLTFFHNLFINKKQTLSLQNLFQRERKNVFFYLIEIPFIFYLFLHFYKSPVYNKSFPLHLTGCILENRRKKVGETRLYLQCGLWLSLHSHHQT